VGALRGQRMKRALSDTEGEDTFEDDDSEHRPG